MKTEEGRFVRGSLTFADPSHPDLDPPRCRRASYPSFTAFEHHTPLTADGVIKLFRAVDRWSASVAVYGNSRSELFVWGVVDQMVGDNIRMNREAMKGFGSRGVLLVNIEGAGDISIYHHSLFLGRLSQNRIITRENDALGSSTVAALLVDTLWPSAESICSALGTSQNPFAMLCQLLEAWETTIARICIGLRRLGTGGSLLITPKPIANFLDIVHGLKYPRLGDSTVLSVLDTQHLHNLDWAEPDYSQRDPEEVALELSAAQADAEDRAEELTGAIKLVTSLATADGVVLLSPSLSVLGFGVKIRAEARMRAVYEGADFERNGTKARKIDPSRFGTRHGSMLRYCGVDRKAIGVVVSQDGHVRVITSVGRNLTLWDSVRLLDYEDDVASYAQARRQARRRGRTTRVHSSLGFSRMPKTISSLLSYRPK
jgi:hypothetical protein